MSLYRFLKYSNNDTILNYEILETFILEKKNAVQLISYFERFATLGKLGNNVVAEMFPFNGQTTELYLMYLQTVLQYLRQSTRWSQNIAAAWRNTLSNKSPSYLLEWSSEV